MSRGVYIHKENCGCTCCKMKKRQFHSQDCLCVSCKNRRGDSHSNGCVCLSCKTYAHPKDCICNFCKATRGENTGSRNGMYGKTGANHPNFGKHWKLSDISKANIGKASARRSEEQKRKEVETRKKNGWYRNRDATIKKMSKPKTDTHLKNILRSVQSKPNCFEIRALDYLNSIHGDSFEYTGNGALVINGRSADAYSKKLNIVALFHGSYWHLVKKGFKVTEENKRSVEKIDSLPFIQAGYGVLFVWEDEI